MFCVGGHRWHRISLLLCVCYVTEFHCHQAFMGERRALFTCKLNALSNKDQAVAFVSNVKQVLGDFLSIIFHFSILEISFYFHSLQ